ncbi:MAG: CPBP family intramembrane glutamic endopeptidase [Halobacteriota archaeon]
MPASVDSRWPTRLNALFEALFVVVGTFFFASLVVIAVRDALVGTGLIALESTELRIATTVVQFIAFGIGVGWYLRATDRWDLIGVRTPTIRHVGYIVIGSVALLGAQVLLSLLLDAIGVSTGANRAITDGMGEPTYFLAMIGISLLLVGPAEELLFRGVLQGRLRASWGAWPAIVLSTVVFGAIHLPAIVGDPGQQYATIALVGTLGLLLGYLYERTGNIVVPAVVHGVHNAAVFGIQYLAAIGVAT